MNNEPITKVYLLDVPLESDYKNTLYFTNATDQLNYFRSKIIGTYEYSNFTYQRKDNIIRIPEQYDKIYNCNYVMYQNSNYSNKWFYAFVTDLEYISDGRTDLHIKTDAIQTWLFDYIVKPSFVEREHTNNDTAGNNLVEEGLELGEYTCVGHSIDTNLNDTNSDLCYIIGCTKEIDPFDVSQTPADSGGYKYNGIYSGVKYYRYDTSASIDIVLEYLASKGVSDAITGIFMIPKILAPIESGTNHTVAESDNAYSYNYSVGKNASLDGYIARNQKLTTYPYCYLLASNNQGGSAIYHYEDFYTTACTFKVKSCLTPGGSIRLIPQSFKGITSNDEEGLNLGKYPVCNYAVDMYTNWLTQNSINIPLEYASNITQTIGGAVSMLIPGGQISGASMMANGLIGIGNTMSEKYKASLVPPQARGNLNCGDVITSTNTNSFHFYNMSIKYNQAEIIDGYFDMYGYKTNLVKVPNTNHRANWWFTKTISCNIVGNIPQNDLEEIKSCYNNGITFWRNPNNIEDYSLDNSII